MKTLNDRQRMIRGRMLYLLRAYGEAVSPDEAVTEMMLQLQMRTWSIPLMLREVHQVLVDLRDRGYVAGSEVQPADELTWVWRLLPRGRDLLERTTVDPAVLVP
jgi:hypothetical protein